MQCKPIVAKASLKKAYGLSTEPLCKIKVGDICTVLFSISNVRKWSFWKWNRRRKETSYFLVEDNCITIVKFTYLLFSTFFLFFSDWKCRSRFENSSFSREWKIWNHRVFRINYVLAKENARESLVVGLIIKFLDSFFLMLGFWIFISFNLIEFKF